MALAYGRNRAFYPRIEAEANQFACANVTGIGAYSEWC
jgi:hypothetical protein